MQSETPRSSTTDQIKKSEACFTCKRGCGRVFLGAAREGQVDALGGVDERIREGFILEDSEPCLGGGGGGGGLGGGEACEGEGADQRSC